MKKQSKIFSFVLMISFAVIFLVGAVNVDVTYAETDEELFSFVPIGLPGRPDGFNDAGEIVGTIGYPERDIYCSSELYSCVYRYSNGNFDVIEYPDALYNEGYDINNAGAIVGNSGFLFGSWWGWVFSDEDGFTTIVYPGSSSVWIWGINNLGEIVGTANYPDYDDHHAFLRDEDGAYHKFRDDLRAAYDINDIGEIVFNGGILYSEGNYIELDISGAQGINNAGEIIFGNGTLRYKDGSTINVQVPDFQNTYGIAINNKGEILLRANDGAGSEDHYFIAKPILGQLVEHSGDVIVSGKPAETGDPIHADDLVEVGDNGLAAFKMRLKEKVQDLDKNLYVDSNSEVKIADKSTTSEIMLELFKGRLRGKVRELPEGILYDVWTPVAAIAVRGTEFLVEVDDSNTIVTVLEGSVEVTSLVGEQSIVLEENQELQATSEGLGEPYEIDPDEIDDWWNESEVYYYYLSLIIR